MLQVFLALLACAPDKPLPEGTDLCPMDPCAAAPSAWEARACCLDAHGYGVTNEDDLARLGDACADGACDPATFISADAALCVALAAGLEPGAEGCAAWLQAGEEGATWVVESILEAECRPGAKYGDAEGVAMIVDAETGEVESTGFLHATLACDP